MIIKLNILPLNNVKNSSSNFQAAKYNQTNSFDTKPSFSLLNNINNTSYAIPLSFLGKIANDAKCEEAKQVEAKANKMITDLEAAIQEASKQKAEVEELFKRGEQFENGVATRIIEDDEITLMFENNRKIMKEYKSDGKTLKRQSTFRDNKLISVIVYNKNGKEDIYKFDGSSLESIQTGVSDKGIAVDQEIHFSTYFESDVKCKVENIQGKKYKYMKATETKERIFIPLPEPAYIAQGITQTYFNSRTIDKKLQFMPEKQPYSYKENIETEGKIVQQENFFYYKDGKWQKIH